MKLYISADIEGIVGVTSMSHLDPQGFEYGAARTWMTDTILAVIEAAEASGVTSFVISDSHGNGQNILLDRLPDNVELVRSFPRPLIMMQGIEDGGFDAAMLVGYHSANMSASGVIAHNLGGDIREVRLNDVVASEAYLSAAVAGHFGVPVAMISGDRPFVEETRSFLGDVEAAIIKESYGMWSVRTPTPAIAHNRVREAVTCALARLDDFTPFRLSTPVKLEIRLGERTTAEGLCLLSNVEPLGDGHSIRYLAEDIVDASRFLQFVDLFTPEAWRS